MKSSPPLSQSLPISVIAPGTHDGHSKADLEGNCSIWNSKSYSDVMTGMCGMSTDTFPSTTTEHYDLSDVLIKNIHSQPGAVAEFGWVEVPKQQYWSPRIEEKLGGWKAKRLVGAEELHRLVDCIICLHH